MRQEVAYEIFLLSLETINFYEILYTYLYNTYRYILTCILTFCSCYFV